jgi:hypothetical protein
MAGKRPDIIEIIDPMVPSSILWPKASAVFLQCSFLSAASSLAFCSEAKIITDWCVFPLIRHQITSNAFVFGLKFSTLDG